MFRISRLACIRTASSPTDHTREKDLQFGYHQIVIRLSGLAAEPPYWDEDRADSATRAVGTLIQVEQKQCWSFGE
jgi:hypothetical protein